MSKANIKLKIQFDFELQAPENLLALDHEALCKTIREALGPTVIQGMPVISSKQLAKSNIQLVAHHHHLDAVNAAVSEVPRELLVQAAPHLTDDELQQVARKGAGKPGAGSDEQIRVLRRHALALVSEYRLVPCVVEARLTSGQDAKLEGKLNLTNGSVVLSEKDRQNRLQPNQGKLAVRVEGVETAMSAAFSGQTLSGPVLGVEIAEIATVRDPLMALWLRQ